MSVLIKTSFSSRITPFFSMSSFAASSFAWMTPAAFVAASRSSLASFNCCSSLITLFWYSSRSSVVASSWALRASPRARQSFAAVETARLERLQAELEKVSEEKSAAVAHQKELQDALDAANKQLKKEAIVIASKDEFIKTLIQTPAAA